jgi:hypothetical protein
MPWALQRAATGPRAGLEISLAAPMAGEWETLLDAVRDDLACNGQPRVIFLPGTLRGASRTDEAMLDELWRTLAAQGISVVLC